MLHFTSFGRAVYAVGSNPEAARLTGISVTGILIAVYAIAGPLGRLRVRSCRPAV